MTKTEATIGNLKLKECESILEFLFSDFSDFSGKGTKKAKENSKNARLKIKASICHEIKNPLNCIISYAELLGKNSNALQKDLKRYVENIKISTTHLKALLLDVIEGAKYEYEKAALAGQNFETEVAIKDVLRAFEYRFEEKGINVRCALICAHITSDFVKFNQILYNLISNAAKYADKNGEIEATSWVQDDKFHFEIKNTGALIRKNEAKTIFGLFQRLERVSSRKEEGFGIGLYVSRELAEALGGELKFQSLNKKTVLSFSVPLK